MSAQSNQQNRVDVLDDQNQCQQSNADPGATKRWDIATQHSMAMKLQLC